jgi:hypothetical protein
LGDEKVHAPDQAAHSFMPRPGGARETAVFQPVGIARLTAATTPRREMSHFRE